MRSFRVRISDKTYLVEVDDTGRSPLQVVVNGRPYAVEVEWQGAAAESIVRPEIVPARPAPEAVASTVAFPAKPPTPQLSESERSSAATVDAPMPGVILDVRAKAGEPVKRGDELCVLEAMKMRNSIRSPRDGVIQEVLVTAGAKVAYGDPLVRYAGPPAS
jgi:biotin carboxyl carrier protein